MLGNTARALTQLIPPLLLTLTSTMSLADHPVTAERNHGDWHSLIVATPTGSFARAITMHVDNSGGISTFNIDSPASDCDTIFFTVNINLSEIQQNGVESPTLFGKFRVDKKVVHDITYTLSIERGDDYISMYISDWSRKDSVLDEIMSGNTARFQFKIEDEAYYYRFSLRGSREAIARQDQICRELRDRDEDYFYEPQEDDDAIYFQT